MNIQDFLAIMIDNYVVVIEHYITGHNDHNYILNKDHSDPSEVVNDCWKCAVTIYY